MTVPTPERRRFGPTPTWLIAGLLTVECLLFLSDRFQWPTWHKRYAVLTAVASVGVVFAAMLLWLILALLVEWLSRRENGPFIQQDRFTKVGG